MTWRLPFNRKYLSLAVTIGLFALMYIVAIMRFPGFTRPQVFLNLMVDNAFLIVTAVGMTFVILSGGIDLSVGAVIALTTIVLASLVEKANFNPFLAIAVVLLMGTVLGLGMGAIIHYFKLPPFVVTLAGMFFARGMCFIISINSITITNPTYVGLSKLRIYLGPLGFVSFNVVIALTVVAVGMYMAHLTNFGRTVYAIGGNEQSAELMGLNVPRTKVLIYTLNGFLAAMAGVVYSLYVLSGHGLYANGLELDAIASVVIGGTLLTGGVGYVFGTFFGVMIQGLIQTVIMFDGTLNTWWTKIVVGLLTLFFILMQRWLSSRSSTRRDVRPLTPPTAATTATAASAPLDTKSAAA
jgi:simple sugar transport system permease protein